VEGLLDLFATPLGETIDCIVLDDGFQHRRIARQLDIVLIDATRSPFEDRLLPAGWLREKISSLRRAHAVVITHAEAVPSSAIASLEALVRESAPAAMLAICHHRWSHVSVFQAGSMRDEPVASLRGRRVAAICAIGNPEPFFREAKEAVGSPLRWTRSLPDHDGYAENRIAEIIEGARQANAEIILATQKDWAKLRLVEESRWPCPFVIARLAIDFDRGGEELRKAVAETVQRGVAD
jgi:tetraacyldisaccharide 4'-kinase